MVLVSNSVALFLLFLLSVSYEKEIQGQSNQVLIWQLTFKVYYI